MAAITDPTPSGQSSPDGLAYDLVTKVGEVIDVLNVVSGAGLGASVAVAADALAIPVTHQFVAKTTGADAEALTLANGTPGQLLTIALVVDGGGTGTLTPTTKSGFATIVFADAGDQVTLRYVDATVGWIIAGATGVAAPPAITI